jgi:glycosyltransferase involved in cell wall biosynthesis
MKVVIFHPVALPPRDYGGTERVVGWLARGLVERGHEVHVAALAGSRLPAGVRLLAVESDRRGAAELAPRLPAGTDVVHFMAPPGDGAASLPCPWLVTVHGNGKPGESFPSNSVFVSADHARRHGATAYVHNGLDPSEYRFDRSKSRSFLFLSKTSWRVKNVAGAIRLCARARAPLRVAGGRRPWLSRLEVLVRRNMSWEGPVAGATKARLLAEAKALVFPVAWPEPFGLVVAEALLSGTPVLASPRGSLPELVPADVGALPADEDGWIDWLSKPALPWDPERCRAWALERFHYARMSEGYEDLYRKIGGGARLHDASPVASDWRNSA